MTLLDKTNTLVIVPAYNEQDSIVSVIEEIKTTGFPFVVIDDGSTDETRIRAIEAGARTISLPFNAGVGGSIKCGMRFALDNQFEAVIQCDADGQHSPLYFEKLVQKSNKVESVIIIGTRFSDISSKMPIELTKFIGIKILSKVVLKRQKFNVSDPTSGFRLTRKELMIKLVRHQPNFYLADTIFPLQVAKILNLGVSEVPVEMCKRKFGESSASFLGAIAFFVRVVFERQSLSAVFRDNSTKS